MSTPVSASHRIPKQKIRPVANFHPNIWGDQFITYAPEDKVTRACKEEELEDLKKEVRNNLTAAAANLSQLLNFIDGVQRLGVAYHFEEEIEEALQQIYDSFHDENDMDGDLYNVALRFRLLRQQGYNISCGIFEKFKDEQGRFKEDLIRHVQGMVSLYEAAHLRVHGEDILEEALAFATIHLKSMVEHLEYSLSKQVAHALKWPTRRGMERLQARWYISVYQDEASHDKTLLKLAKLDFNLVQSLHKKELSNLARWRTKLDFVTKLPFVRDRLVEGYFWVLGVYFEPQYLRARRFVTKVFCIASAIDDIYDAYGTFEELEHFTEAIERWDINCIDHLPEYMKVCYAALLDIYKEMEDEMEKEGYRYRVHYAIEVMKNHIRGYWAEANWFHKGHVPTVEEYMRVAIVTSGYTLIATSSFIGMKDIVTKETLDWMAGNPKIISSSNLMARLMDDMKSHKFEQKRGHVASAIECYVKQYGVSEEQVYNEFYKQVEVAWLDINHECIKPTVVPMPILTRVVNLSRLLDVIYEEGDGYTNVGKVMKFNIQTVLIDPIA